MCSLAHPAGERVENKDLFENLDKNVIDCLMNESVSNCCLADVALFRLRYKKLVVGTMLILKCREILLELKNIVLEVALKELNGFSFTFSTLKLVPRLKIRKFNGTF